MVASSLSRRLCYKITDYLRVQYHSTIGQDNGQFDFFMTMNEKYLTCHEMTFLKWTCGPTFIDIRHKLLI